MFNLFNVFTRVLKRSWSELHTGYFKIIEIALEERRLNLLIQQKRSGKFYPVIYRN